MIQSLVKRKHALATPEAQIEFLEADAGIPAFGDKLAEIDLLPLKPIQLEIFQINVGKMCNQVCKHCHVDAGPDRKEIMEKETMSDCLKAIEASPGVHTVDLTGGAPEMNPHFRWFVEELSRLGKKVIVRSNLTIILANPKYHDLPQFFRKHRVNVVSSLPHFTARRTDSQRGDGVFDKSIRALQMLNKEGYGRDPELQLDLVYNPSGAYLPGDQKGLEAEFKRRLKSKYEIDFNQLFTITNLPISRFLEYLVNSENYDSYMEELVNAFNPLAAEQVMCRNTISIGWDGKVYDCDFNQMLELEAEALHNISDFDPVRFAQRDIKINNHCYGCTAGAGSSCGGSTT